MCENHEARSQRIPSRHDEKVQEGDEDVAAMSSIKDSLTRSKKGKMPALGHLLNVASGRVLSLAADKDCVYAGCASEDNEIYVFSRNSLRPTHRLLGHQGSILALLIVEEKGWLISSSSAGDIRIWCTTSLEPVYIIHPCDNTSGDIYSLAWDSRNGGTLYFGSQSASIEWINFSNPLQPKSEPPRIRKPSLPAQSASVTEVVPDPTNPPSPGNSSGHNTPRDRSMRYKPHRFFDDLPPSRSGASTPASTPGCLKRQSSRVDHLQSKFDTLTDHLSREESPKSRRPSNQHNQVDGAPVEVVEVEIAPDARALFAHYGYIHCLHIIPRPNNEVWLVSGSGDCDIKIWKASPCGGLEHIRTFDNLSGSVHSFAYRDSLLFVGKQDGQISVWDLETFSCIRKIDAHDSDVLAMSVLGTDLYSAAADGKVIRFSGDFDCTAIWKAHQGTILSSTIIKAADKWEFITSGNDSFIKIWTVDAPRPKRDERKIEKVHVNGDDDENEGDGDVMLLGLSKLVAVPTVSDEAHRESCRQGAHLLKKLLQQLGSQSEIISGEEGRNPLVLATFSGTSATDQPRKRVLFYGHYDVQPAEERGWETDAWTLSGRNGYLYGRGVSDNKGPIMAVACAASELRQQRELDIDVIMLIEGEEEAGSRGFANTVRRHKETIGQIDAVLFSNSTWVGEKDPCVVFGMRGVVYANIAISSQGEDAHSGVDGGSVAEPMIDMIRVLGAVADHDKVSIPGFYDLVRPRDNEEMAVLKDVADATGKNLEDLAKVWRDPSFSIANISSSSNGNKTVIPKRVTADISMRIVPDQDLEIITQNLKDYCTKTFDDLQSSNHFEINVTHSASWWLASLDSPYLQALEGAIQDVWGVKPLKIREGGTVPTIFWLEREFQAPCVHLPLGQSSDAGHLANERMRLLNLRNGKRVLESFFSRISGI